MFNVEKTFWQARILQNSIFKKFPTIFDATFYKKYFQIPTFLIIVLGPVA